MLQWVFSLDLLKALVCPAQYWGKVGVRVRQGSCGYEGPRHGSMSQPLAVKGSSQSTKWDPEAGEAVVDSGRPAAPLPPLRGSRPHVLSPPWVKQTN